MPTAVRPPDDDPRFTATRLSSAELDAHVEELEARLRDLDDEVFPGVDREADSGSSGTEADGNAPGGSAKPDDPSGEKQ